MKTAQGASKKRKLFGRKSQFIAFFTTQRLQRNRGFCAFFRICSFIVNKNDFLLAVHEYLKAFGYRKNKSYWFLSNGELVYCVYVQSSQWDANDYYVEVGIAIEEIVGPKPSVTRWHVRKRCEDESQNDRNISLSVLKQAIDFFSDIHTVNDLTLYLERTPHTLVGLQYELFSNT